MPTDHCWHSFGHVQPPTPTLNWHKGLGLCNPGRGGVWNLLQFSPFGVHFWSFSSSSPHQDPGNLSNVVHKTSCCAGFQKCCESQHSNHSSGIRCRRPLSNRSQLHPRRQGNKLVSFGFVLSLVCFLLCSSNEESWGGNKGIIALFCLSAHFLEKFCVAVLGGMRVRPKFLWVHHKKKKLYFAGEHKGFKCERSRTCWTELIYEAPLAQAHFSVFTVSSHSSTLLSVFGEKKKKKVLVSNTPVDGDKKM